MNQQENLETATGPVSDLTGLLGEDIRRKALIDAAKMIYKYADEYVERFDYSDSAKADAWTMTVAVKPILDELGMKWPEVLDA